MLGLIEEFRWIILPQTLYRLAILLLVGINLFVNDVVSTVDLWPLDRPEGMPSIQSLEVMCGKDHMDVHLTFSQPFEGIVSSKGQHGDPRCVYVPPSTGQTFFSFRIAYSRCGTKPDLHGQFYENTVVVQYDKDLLEVWDEAKRLRCEWFNDYEKTASKPPMVIADLDVIQLDFRGDNVDCWMEIQHGKGPWAPPVSGIVPLGSTLTLVVAINDYRGEFDMRVKSCAASDGGDHVIQLSDEAGCVLRPKMISRFLKARGADERASVITYAFFHAFKFPDALSVHIKCKVEICRHGCLDHCQLQPVDSYNNNNNNNNNFASLLDRKDEKLDDVDDGVEAHHQHYQNDFKDGGVFDGLNDANGGVDSQTVEIALNANLNDQRPQTFTSPNDDKLLDITGIPLTDKLTLPQDQFPYGPRNLDDPDRPSPAKLHHQQQQQQHHHYHHHQRPTLNRKRRQVIVSDRKARSADVGVSGFYDVISEADLAFSPDNRAEAVTVFQGRIREEVVYGICMPMPGFSLLFVLAAVSAVVAALVAGSLLHRYQMQKEQMPNIRQRTNSIPMGIFSGFKIRVRKPTNNVGPMTNNKMQSFEDVSHKNDET